MLSKAIRKIIDSFGLLVVLGVAANISYTDYSRHKLLRKAVAIEGPYIAHHHAQSRPEPSQKNIDYAMKVFQIQVGSNIVGPTYDPDLNDRGLTSSVRFSSERIVTIGPSAFSSWAILGSTLAHEIEVHGNQSFLKIALIDIYTFSHNGTNSAEREAYMFELHCKDRFHLSRDEVDAILSTMDYFYSEYK